MSSAGLPKTGHLRLELIIPTKKYSRWERLKLTLGYTEILDVVILAPTDSSVTVYCAGIIILYQYSGSGRWMGPELGMLIL